MKSLNQYIQEKLIINKNYRDTKIAEPKSFDELRKIIKDRYKNLGPGTEQDPVDFNDIDVSNLDSFCSNNTGIFDETRFKYIDISYWDVSNIKLTNKMFYNCVALKYIGDISGWDVSNVTNMSGMFYGCEELESVGDISKWDVSNVTDMWHMFAFCEKFNQDISKWNVSNVTNMHGMFGGCESFNQDLSKWNVSNVTNMAYMFNCCVSFNQDISKWDVSNVRYKNNMFDGCLIKEEYKPKFK